MSRNNRSQYDTESTKKGSDELTFKEAIQNAMLISLIAGFFCLVWLWDSGIQHYFDFLPRPWVITGAKWLLGLPAAYGTALILFLKRREIWGWIVNRVQRAPAQTVTKDKAVGVLGLLPAPIKAEYERSGQGYARQIPSAFEHVGLTKSGQRVGIKDVMDGPAAARVVISLPAGLRLSRVENASRDIQAAIGAPSLQVQAGPFANTAALIVTHRNKHPVVLRQILDTEQFKKLLQSGGLPVPVGVNEIGEPVLTDMTRIAHLLVAGATGAGKSWWLNAVLTTWILFLGPDKLRLILVDPKKVELSQYADFPHVLSVAREAKDAVTVMQRLVNEMNYRYTLFTNVGVRNIAGYRQKTGENIPYIACVIDELSELMVQAGKTIEPLLMSLAQLARACGIHLIVATQRPSVDVITGVIKANLPSRVCFRLAKNHDYMTVLDDDPHVTLTGNGDGLAAIEGELGLIRFQSPGVGISDQQFDDTIIGLKKYWAERNVSPSDVPGFMGGTINLSCNKGTANNDDGYTVDLDVEMDFPEESAEEQSLEERLKKYICQLVIDTGEEEEEVFLPPIATIARELSVRRARLDTILPSFEEKGWISPGERIGKTSRRRILVDLETALKCK